MFGDPYDRAQVLRNRPALLGLRFALAGVFLAVLSWLSWLLQESVNANDEFLWLLVAISSAVWMGCAMLAIALSSIALYRVGSLGAQHRGLAVTGLVLSLLSNPCFAFVAYLTLEPLLRAS